MTDLSKYPKTVQLNTIIKMTEGFGGSAELGMGRVIVTANKYNFAHEMGHAAAHILGIENTLGEMVRNTPGSQKTTAENIFCYGAQCDERGQYSKAIAEYAADAIQAYTENWIELPANIRNYIAANWK
jgi:hypothetical protein